MKKHQFKPFDQVLVRDEDEDIWRAMHYSHYDAQRNVHYCTRAYWIQCIPYNENTAHLVGTNQPYEEPEPTVWCVKNLNTQIHHRFTQKQFESFIKDISNSTDGHVYYIHRSDN